VISIVGSNARSDRGMTLVEVLVSLVVLSMVSLSLISGLIMAMNLGKLARQRSVATVLASGRVHHILALPFQTAANFAGYQLPEETAAAGPPIVLTSDYGQIPDHPDFKRVVVLTYDVPVAGLLTVESTVSWQNNVEGERSHRMVAFVDPGLK